MEAVLKVGNFPKSSIKAVKGKIMVICNRCGAADELEVKDGKGNVAKLNFASSIGEITDLDGKKTSGVITLCLECKMLEVKKIWGLDAD